MHQEIILNNQQPMSQGCLKKRKMVTYRSNVLHHSIIRDLGA